MIRWLKGVKGEGAEVNLKVREGLKIEGRGMVRLMVRDERERNKIEYGGEIVICRTKM